MIVGFDAKRAYYNTRGLGSYSRTVLEAVQKYFPSNDYHLFKPRKRGRIWNNDTGFAVHDNGVMPGAYWRTFQLGSEVQNKGLDIFHGLSNELPIFLPSKTTRYVVTVHDLIWWKHPEYYPLIDKQIYKWKILKAMANADHVIAVSENTKLDLIDFFPEVKNKISVIYPPCGEVFYQKKSDLNLHGIREKFNLPERFILYVGSLSKNKGVGNLIIMLSQIDSGLSLVIVGEGSEKGSLSELSKKHKVAKRIYWLAQSTNPDQMELSGIYQMALATILSSQYEGFGLPIIESLASRTPVITINHSSLPEAAGPGAVYANSSSPDDLSVAITTLLSDTQLYNWLSNVGIEHALRFKPQSKVRELMGLYQNLMP
ncbi:MAG: glycosyltransferase family 1 protein [Bacteroidetes bacterium]|nr:glycosyltransferase family 1 protein [Bacteroidota bacterium]MDA1120261.1 glycosyltransferase family 1 protein [Bacteroidota bacterium]